ncbi:MAG: replication restart helicase PriA [Nitrospiria bacterium]
MSHLYADVAVPKPVEQVFQYQIPSHLSDQIKVGQRVKIPFGRQVIHGYVVGFSRQAKIEKIKSIIEVLDKTPGINPELLALSQWISSYYLSFPGMILKMILSPLIVKSKTERSYVLNIPFDQIEEEIFKLKSAPRQAEILQLFLKNQTRCWDKTWGNPAVCKSLVLKNILKEIDEEVVRDPYGDSVTGAPAPDLTGEQAQAVQKIKTAIEQEKFQSFLLHGVTGSGKTEVYLRALEHTIKYGKEGLLVVPEISLTPQVIQQVKGRFGSRVAVIHSGLSAGERADAWKRIQNGEISIVVGVRSSIFAPFPRLGLIIIDEEHDTAYKQDNEVKYHARDTALVRAKQIGAVIVLGSATPSFESYYNSQSGKSEALFLTRRIAGRPLPAVTLINLKESPPVFKNGGISHPLHQAIQTRLDKKEQVLLFLNRRGFFPFLLCYDCGFTLKCRYCSVSLTFHKKSGNFHCHYCEYWTSPLVVCPGCHGSNLAYLGQGTEKIEEELNQLYPSACVKRMDRDTTTKKFSTDHILKEMREQEIDILIGTQMVTKGHDLPHITLVGVLCADAILNFPDFRSAERTFQTLTQVAGRAGRGGLPGEVYIQTYNPDHYSIAFAKEQNYPAFYHKELLFRKELNYPPFSRLVSFLFSGPNEKKVEEKAKMIAGFVACLKNPFIEVLGPAPAPLLRLKGKYRWRCLIKGREVKKIQTLSREILKKWAETKKEGVNLDIDVDPQNLL